MNNGIEIQVGDEIEIPVDHNAHYVWFQQRGGTDCIVVEDTIDCTTIDAKQLYMWLKKHYEREDDGRQYACTSSLF